LEAIGAGLDLVSGLHTRLNEDMELSRAARARGVRLHDLRRVAPEYLCVARGSWRMRTSKTILTVGTDCNVGKMTASLELHREFARRGLSSSFVATGQTGILLSGAGVAVDSVLSDYVAGAIEHELDRVEAEGRRYLHVEGQGSITHQGYSGVTLGLLHGVMPDAMVLVHHPVRHRDDYGHPLDDVVRAIGLYEALLAPFKASRVVAVAVNGIAMAPAEASRAKAALEEATRLPAVDVLADGPGRIADALVAFFGD
jgi:uncharacterized NAD-dependent epimerase/dehydratase family protein